LLFSLILRVVVDRGDSEDVLQEVFMRVWDRADSYTAALGTPSAWLVRIARNRAIDRLRSRRVRAHVAESVEDAPIAVDLTATANPELLASTAEHRRAIEWLARRLGARSSRRGQRSREGCTRASDRGLGRKAPQQLFGACGQLDFVGRVAP